MTRLNGRKKSLKTIMNNNHFNLLISLCIGETIHIRMKTSLLHCPLLWKSLIEGV